MYLIKRVSRFIPLIKCCREKKVDDELRRFADMCFPLLLVLCDVADELVGDDDDDSDDEDDGGAGDDVNNARGGGSSR
jgi:hypothetical protein